MKAWEPEGGTATFATDQRGKSSHMASGQQQNLSDQDFPKRMPQNVSVPSADSGAELPEDSEGRQGDMTWWQQDRSDN